MAKQNIHVNLDLKENSIENVHHISIGSAGTSGTLYAHPNLSNVVWHLPVDTGTLARIEDILTITISSYFGTSGEVQNGDTLLTALGKLQQQISDLINSQGTVFEFSIPSTQWIITHNLNKFPEVTLVDADGYTMIADIKYDLLDNTTITVNFNSITAGKAILN